MAAILSRPQCVKSVFSFRCYAGMPYDINFTEAYCCLSLRRNISLIVAKWRHMVVVIWINIGSDNGLLPEGTKPLFLTNVHSNIIGIYPSAISQKLHKIYWKLSLKIMLWQIFMHLPGDNELILLTDTEADITKWGKLEM